LLYLQSDIILDVSWEKEFQAQELQLDSFSQPVHAEQTKPQLLHDADELALTAGLLLDNLKHEENPKFQNSQFMGLMKQFRDREVTVDGNKIVENDGRATIVDAKGKARAVAQVPLSKFRCGTHLLANSAAGRKHGEPTATILRSRIDGLQRMKIRTWLTSNEKMKTLSNIGTRNRYYLRLRARRRCFGINSRKIGTSSRLVLQE
jgi:hypothetical protein